MSYQLRIDELLSALQRDGDPRADGFKASLEAIGDAMANVLVSSGEFVRGPCTSDLCLAVCFYPIEKGDDVPSIIAGYDDPAEYQKEGE